ncbi:UNVERIFIED_CONTAM: hypothetical protein PYX00_002841 [Menopon gallinae]|uniref:Uncharacterized protein n=1 Tax=Menopon gallinae TaxID=328185 RepID=A0AAW2HZE6_9NEOP
MAMYFRSNTKPSNTVFIVYDFLTYISGVMYYLSTTINPLLYHIMSHKFREAFKVSTLIVLLLTGLTYTHTINPFNEGKISLYTFTQ